MGVLFLFVLQVQTLYYSPDHKLVDRGLVIEGQSEVFGGEEDHLHFVQVPPSSAATESDGTRLAGLKLHPPPPPSSSFQMTPK